MIYEDEPVCVILTLLSLFHMHQSICSTGVGYLWFHVHSRGRVLGLVGYILLVQPETTKVDDILSTGMHSYYG